MPRPNRYHPYTRNSSQASSPRFPPTPQLSPDLSVVANQPLARPYQYIYPGYIRGTTSDGKALTIRSIIQAPDGMLHVQMQVVRKFPSEDVKHHPSLSHPSPPVIFQDPIDPAIAGWGSQKTHAPRKDSAIAVSHEQRNAKNGGATCAVGTGWEDAVGEVDDMSSDEYWRTYMQHQRVLDGTLGQGPGQ